MNSRDEQANHGQDLLSNCRPLLPGLGRPAAVSDTHHADCGEQAIEGLAALGGENQPLRTSSSKTSLTTLYKNVDIQKALDT